MQSPSPTLDDLEAVYEMATGRMRPLFEATGAILSSKLDAQGLTVGDATMEDLAAILHASLLEAASQIYPHHAMRVLEPILKDAFGEIRLDLMANSDGSNAIH